MPQPNPEPSWLKRIGRGIVTLFRDFVIACWEVFKLPFVLIAIGFKRFFALGVRKITLFAIAAVVVTIVTLTALVEATSRPGFCVSCHVMKPYFDAWEVSTHNDISCVTCHVPPGLEGTIKHKFMAFSMVVNYVTGLYKRSKPWAEIDDAACLREGCHDTRLLKGVEDFKNVVFDHRPHLEQPRRDRRLRCTSCHAQIVQGEHISVTEGTCFLCHFMPDSGGRPTDLARCTHCHHPPAGAAADTTFDHAEILSRQVDCVSCHTAAVSGDGYVPPERCSSCHAQLEHIERYGDLEFVHQKHVTDHKVECTHCHIAIRHGTGVASETEPARQCAACHGGPDNAVERVWNGQLPGLPRTMSAMARVGMSCASCHAEPIHLDNGKFSPPVCSPCHEETYNSLWQSWEVPLRTAAKKLEADAKMLPAAERDSILRALTIYQRGNPVHNPEILAPLAEKIKGGAIDAGSCEVCHPAAVDHMPVWNGRTVPHHMHAAKKIACEICHETTQDRHGRLTAKAVSCEECHHQTADVNNCASCHSYQMAVYRGTLPGAPGTPSAMAAADIACTDCHTLDGRNVARTNVETCVACHDPSYSDSLRAWQMHGDKLLEECEHRMSVSNRTKSDHIDRELAAALIRDGSRSVHNPLLFTEWAKRTEVWP